MALWHVMIGPFEALRRLGWTGRYILLGPAQAQDELTRLKDPSLFTVTANAMFTEDLPIHAEIREAAQKAGTKYPAHYMGEGYGSAMVLEAALQKCGWPCDKEKLVRAMATLTVDMRGLRGGPLEWTETNHYRKANLYNVYRWDKAKNGIVTWGTGPASRSSRHAARCPTLEARGRTPGHMRTCLRRQASSVTPQAR